MLKVLVNVFTKAARRMYFKALTIQTLLEAGREKERGGEGDSLPNIVVQVYD